MEGIYSGAEPDPPRDGEGDRAAERRGGGGSSPARPILRPSLRRTFGLPPRLGEGRPKCKMGAGVATGPHLSRVRTAAPVRAWRLSWAGRTPWEQAPREFGVPAEVLRPRSVPYEHLSGEPDGYPFAVPPAEAFGPADLRRKWDRLAPHASSSMIFHRFGGLRSEDRRPLPRWSRLRTFFPEGKSALPREGPY